MNYSNPNPTPRKKALLYKAPPGTVILLLVLLTVCSVFAASSGSAFLRLLCITAGSGLFAFSFLLTFQPAVVLTALPGFFISFFLAGGLVQALPSLFFLAGGTVLTLCMLKRCTKTQTVLASSLALGLALTAVLLIAFFTMQEAHGADSLSGLYDSYFDTLRDQLVSSVQTAGAALTDPAEIEAFASYTAALPTALDALFDSVKPMLPSMYGTFCLLAGYLSVSFFQGAVRLFRCRLLVPRDFKITVSKTAGVLYIICYLILLFSPSAHPTLLASAVQNLLMLLMPGLLIVGLHSLRRRAKDPVRRASFITTLVLLGLSLYINPAICVFIIIIDGIGEVFFGSMPTIRPR